MNETEKLYASLLCHHIGGLLDVQQYDLLKICYKYLDKPVNADMLLNLERPIRRPPEQQFYYDICTIVEQDIRKRPAIYAEVVIGYYKNQFLDVYNEMRYNQIPDGEVLKNYFELGEKGVCDIYMEAPVYRFLLFLYKYNNHPEMLQYWKEHFFKDNSPKEVSDYENIKKSIMQVFENPEQYRKYIKQCRKYLARLAKVPEEKLERKLLQDIKQNLSIGVKTIFDYENNTDWYALTQLLISSQGGGILWYNGLLKECRDSAAYRKFQYKPNVSLLIENYYSSFLLSYENLLIEVRKKAKATNLDNGNLAITYSKVLCSEDDYNAILRAFSLDVIYHLFYYTWKRLYEIKLVELNSGFDLMDRADRGNGLFLDQSARIRELEALLEKQQQEQELYKQYVESLKVNNFEFSKLQEEKSTFLKEFSDKLSVLSEENKRLEERVRYQNQLLEEMQKPDPDPEEDLNFDLLHTFKYLFVGNLTTLGLGELKKKFPNSVFCETETSNINNLKVDAVIILTKCMSHSMYYKVKSVPELSNLPWIYFNNKNMSGLLTAIHKSIFSK